MWNESELAYLAGIIDGDGCITSLYNQRIDKYIAHFGVTTTDLVLADWLRSHFGGTVYSRRPQKGYEARRAKYEWLLYQAAMDLLLPQILPFLVVKKDRALAMIAFRGTYGRRRVVPQEILSERARLHRLIRSFNHHRDMH